MKRTYPAINIARRHAGFTLIELIVSIGVLLVLSGVIIANYNTYSSTQVLKQAALSLKNNIRLIQTKSASGLKPNGSCVTLVGYELTFTANGYSYQANCEDVPTGGATSISFPSGITLPMVPTTNPIIFFVLERGTNLSTSETILLSGFGKEYGIQIGPNGDISDLGIQ